MTESELTERAREFYRDTYKLVPTNHIEYLEFAASFAAAIQKETREECAKIADRIAANPIRTSGDAAKLNAAFIAKRLRDLERGGE